jgi:hypothetical protein
MERLARGTKDSTSKATIMLLGKLHAWRKAKRTFCTFTLIARHSPDEGASTFLS